MSTPELIVGIDLGTTNSVVAYLDHSGRPISVTNFEGEITTPSKVLIEGQSVVVGREAHKAARVCPERFAECFKRNMGDDFFPQSVDNRQWRPEVLSAMVLKRLWNDTIRRLGDLNSAVITVPAYFDECRRRATSNAGEIAGWRVVDIINEPTAAAIAYAHREGTLGRTDSKFERILVYDLGGGTFDVTILQIRHGLEYRTMATEGEVRLGGCDWDERLRNYLADQFRSKTGCDPLATPHGQVEFTQIAESAKESLSARKSVTVPCVLEGRRAVLEVTRETFEQLTAALLERSRITTELLLPQAGMTWEDIDRVLMIGGSTRMPMVGRMLETLTGKKPDASLSADEAVAHGAAIYARLKGTKSNVQVINVNSHTYRVIGTSKDGKREAVPMVRKNTPLPAEGGRLCSVRQPGQESCVIEVCEGESRDPDVCATIGQLVVRDLPMDKSKKWKVAVTIMCKNDGKLSVKASVRDPDSPDTVIQEAHATLEPTHGMSASEVARSRQLLAALEIN